MHGLPGEEQLYFQTAEKAVRAETATEYPNERAARKTVRLETAETPPIKIYAMNWTGSGARCRL